MFPDNKRSSDGAELRSNSRRKRRAPVQAPRKSSSSPPPPPPGLDEDLHSHYLVIYGEEAMRRLINSNILISGMTGLGVEIAKNLILAGVRSVTLHDEGLVDMWDLSGSYVFSEEDLGKKRATTSVKKLKQLTDNVTKISMLQVDDLTTRHLSRFQAVVFTEFSLEKAIEFDDYCHHHQPPIAFITSQVRGLFGSVYCDFGPRFTFFDVDGEEPHTGIIASISNSYPARVVCVEYKMPEFQNGNLVVFSGVRGMIQLNDGQPRKIIIASDYSFTIEEDTTNYHVYEGGGIVTQFKEPKVLNFKPLRQALEDPGNFVEISDLIKSPALLHLAFQALDRYMMESGCFPLAGSEEDAQTVISLVTDINNGLGDQRLEEIDHMLLRKFTFGSSAVLAPMATIFGGIVGQEVVKACSGKFHPIFQFFYFDSSESLPTESPDPDDLKSLNCRYDAQISVFGSKLQKKLEEAKVLIVGSGASGCEILKHAALMGVCCGEGGKLTVTDDKVIEKSDISKLFRNYTVGYGKTEAVTENASRINPRLRVQRFPLRVDHETEHVFDDTFWENLSVVIAAVGKKSVRLYLDQRCMYFQKALLVLEALGTECRTQMMIPHITEHFISGPSMDPYEIEAPSLTQQLTPHNFNECLTWARSEFTRLFETTPSNVNAYLSNETSFLSFIEEADDPVLARVTLERVVDCLYDRDRCNTFDECIAWGRMKFEGYFANPMKHLINKSSDDDAATSRELFPNPLQFNSEDLTHLDFVKAAAIVKAETFLIPIPTAILRAETSLHYVADATVNMITPEVTPWEDLEVLNYEKVSTRRPTPTSEKFILGDELLVKLERCRDTIPPGFHMNPVEFEKDCKHYMDLIASIANLRARNYGIREVDKLKVKFITERIIPKVSTSTAVATGLVCLELYKVLGGNKEVGDYRNAFVNLAVPSFTMHEPSAPMTFGHRDETWTVWDRWILRDNPTLRQLIQWLTDKDLCKFNVWFQNYPVYSSEIPSHEDRLDTKVFDLVKDAPPGFEVPSGRSHFDVLVECETADGRNIGIPVISICFK